MNMGISLNEIAKEGDITASVAQRSAKEDKGTSKGPRMIGMQPTLWTRSYHITWIPILP